MSEVIKSEGGGIFIDCRPREFGDFIAGLLQSSRAISNTLAMTFEITRQDVFDVVSLIRQRIAEQHESSLVEAVATIVFEDGRTVRLNHLNEFESYADIGHQLASSISVSMVFLIKAPRDSVPHKQSVAFKFSTKAIIPSLRSQRLVVMDDEPVPYESFASYRVEHTLLSFGEDMSNLLEKKLKAFMIDNLKDLASRKWYSLSGYLLLLLLINIGIAAGLGKLVGSVLLPVEWSYPSDGISGLQSIGIYLYLIITSAVLMLILGPVAYNWFFKARPSFIKLSQSAESEAKRRIDKHRKRLVVFVLAAIGSITVGAIGSLVATGLWEGILTK